MLQNEVEEAGKILAGLIKHRRGHTVAANGVKHREFELILVGAKIDEQVVDLVQDFLRPGIGAVDLVDHDQNGQARVQGFLEHEPGLGQRALGGVHQQHRAVDHGQGALHFPAKSAWPGVSTILIFTPFQRTEQFLAAMVIPRSRSRSMESITRSSMAWLSRNTPDCRNMTSTRVVLPWST